MKTSYNFNTITQKIHINWMKFINQEKDLLQNILKIIDEKDNSQIFPKPQYVFRTLRFFSPNETKVVILGQDPYPGYQMIDDKLIPYACGLSFSVSKKITKIPGSLKNIFKEINNNYPDFKMPKHGSLINWVKKEKILLLNSGLTVEKKKPGVHLKYWMEFTDKLINWLSVNNNNIIFVLMGNFAKKKSKLIDEKKHMILTCVHPSPLSAHRGFFGCDIFKKINFQLKKYNKTEITFS